jgi:hypothetical protein
VDALPFRVEQLRVEDHTSLEQLLDLRDDRVLEWTFVPSAAIAVNESRRGPNGLWLLWRGTEHPLEHSFASQLAYYLKDSHCPAVITEIDDWREAETLELFRTYGDAAERASEDKEVFKVDYEVAVASGSELLRLISAVDVIDIGGGRFPLTFEGQRLCRMSQVASAAALVAAITR